MIQGLRVPGSMLLVSSSVVQAHGRSSFSADASVVCSLHPAVMQGISLVRFPPDGLCYHASLSANITRKWLADCALGSMSLSRPTRQLEGRKRLSNKPHAPGAIIVKEI